MVDAATQTHLDEYHLFATELVKEMVSEHNELVKTVPENKKLLERVIVALDGIPEYDVRGKKIGTTGGMVSKQAKIERDLAAIKFAGNGGGGFSIRNKDKMIIGLIAAIPSVMLVIVAYIQGLS